MNPKGWPSNLPKAPTCEDCSQVVSLAWLETPRFTDHGPQCIKCAESCPDCGADDYILTQSQPCAWCGFVKAFAPETDTPTTVQEAVAFWKHWGMNPFFHPDDCQHLDEPSDARCAAAWALKNPWADDMTSFWNEVYGEPGHECSCIRCDPRSGSAEDYCYHIAFNIDEKGNYHDDDGQYRNGQTGEIIEEVSA